MRDGTGGAGKIFVIRIKVGQRATERQALCYLPAAINLNTLADRFPRITHAEHITHQGACLQVVILHTEHSNVQLCSAIQQTHLRTHFIGKNFFRLVLEYRWIGTRYRFAGQLTSEWVGQANLISFVTVGLIVASSLEASTDAGVEHGVLQDIPLHACRVGPLVFVATQASKRMLPEIRHQLLVGRIGEEETVPKPQLQAIGKRHLVQVLGFLVVAQAQCKSQCIGSIPGALAKYRPAVGVLIKGAGHTGFGGVKGSRTDRPQLGEVDVDDLPTDIQFALLVVGAGNPVDSFSAGRDKAYFLAVLCVFLVRGAGECRRRCHVCVGRGIVRFVVGIG